MRRMKSVLFGLALVALMGLPVLVVQADDEIQKWEDNLKRRDQSLRLREKQLELDRRAARIEQKEQAVKEGRWMDLDSRHSEGEGRGEGHPHGWKGDREHHGWYGKGSYGKGWRCPFWKKILFYLGILHLLLAVIVYKDIRSAVPRMNGLWVVVVLMGGIPATVAYAVFRLAMVQSAKQPPAH